MNLQEQLAMCSYHYKKWKDLALSSLDSKEAKKRMERAFFWLELRSAFFTLFMAERMKGTDPKVRKKLIIAKTNLTKKLADYASQILDELDL